MRHFLIGTLLALAALAAQAQGRMLQLPTREGVTSALWWHWHGFAGVEADTVARFADWIRRPVP